MRVKSRFTGCVDCIAFVANGTIPEDRPELPDLIAARFPGESHHIVNADEEGEEEHFSRSGCDCCGSHLGGMRGKLALLAEG